MGLGSRGRPIWQSPKLLDNLRRIRRRHEEIGDEPEATGYLAVKYAHKFECTCRELFGIALTARCDFDNILS